MWEHIRKLKGENIKGKGDLKIYGSYKWYVSPTIGSKLYLEL